MTWATVHFHVTVHHLFYINTCNLRMNTAVVHFLKDLEGKEREGERDGETWKKLMNADFDANL